MLQKRQRDAEKWEGILTLCLLGYGDDCRRFACFYVGNREYEVSGAVRTWMVDLGKLIYD